MVQAWELHTKSKANETSSEHKKIPGGIQVSITRYKTNGYRPQLSVTSWNKRDNQAVQHIKVFYYLVWAQKYLCRGMSFEDPIYNPGGWYLHFYQWDKLKDPKHHAQLTLFGFDRFFGFQRGGLIPEAFLSFKDSWIELNIDHDHMAKLCTEKGNCLRMSPNATSTWRFSIYSHYLSTSPLRALRALRALRGGEVWWYMLGNTQTRNVWF